MECERTLMTEKNVAPKYWREAIITTVHTLNQVQLKKGTKRIPYELWYGYNPNVWYLRVFGRKLNYILKDVRKEKLETKSEEGIFLGYSNKRKAYKCLNLTTHKVIESTHVKIDVFAYRSEEYSNKEPKDYMRFVYYEEEPTILQHFVVENQ